MSFKNAVKLLCTKFHLVWLMTLATFITMVIVVSLGQAPVREIYKLLENAGLIGRFADARAAFVTTGDFAEFMNALIAVTVDAYELLGENAKLVVSVMIRLGLIVLVVLKFILTTFELPLHRLIQGQMSDNARLGFLNTYVSFLGKSALYSLVKAVVFAAIDSGGIALGVLIVNGLSAAPVLIPFAVMVLLIAFFSIRSTIFFAWSPYILLEKRGVFSALGRSVKLAFKNFAKIVSGFLITWIIIFAILMFVTVFTVGIGLIVAVPLFQTLLAFLNMTYFYGKTGLRYYLDGKIFDPNLYAQGRISDDY